MKITRRDFLAGTAGLAAGAAVTVPFFRARYAHVQRRSGSLVAILHAERYSEGLTYLLLEGLRSFRLDVRNKSVLLKPNLVDFIAGGAINTNPMLVAAAVECFRRLGARSVVVAEGPGHHRDTFLVLSQSGFARQLQDLRVPFVDLNRTELRAVPLKAAYTNLGRLWLPSAVLDADFVVSMPKVKAHHWSGVTLSMKNMFGVVPGNRYGWPKNLLHWHGIQESVLDICATVPIHFVIADAIIAMEGNGPLNGVPRPLGRIVLADDPVAADATCARLMGLMPERVPHLYEASKFLGNIAAAKITQAGERVEVPSKPFDVVPEFKVLQFTSQDQIA